MTITEGSGTGATAIAHVDLDPASGTYGQVTGFTVTNPGSGYAADDVLTITLVGGGATFETAAGVVTFNGGNVSGGLTKTGLGTLTLGGTNTYTGTSSVEQGALSVTGSVAGDVSLSAGATLMGTMGLIFLLFPAQIVGFFTDDPLVIALGTMPLRMVGIIQPLLAAAMIFAGGLRGAGDTRFPMIVTGASIWLLRVPLSYVFALVLGWGLPGAWAAFALDLSVRGVLNFLRFRSGRWKTVKV